MQSQPSPPHSRQPRSFVVWLLQKRWRMSRGLTLGGQVCVIDAAGHVLLIRHGYRPGWHFPGGGVETGECVVDAALRELAEETGVLALGRPQLHGIFNHAAAFPGDHIVLYVLREYSQAQVPQPGYEIAEQRFFAPDALPAAINPGTRRRIAEISGGTGAAKVW